MNRLKKIDSRFGYIEIFTNEENNILYAIPNGYVGIELVKKDLEFLKNFDANRTEKWTYIVNVSKVKIINPLNPFLLTELKNLSKMNEYIVYAPALFVRFMLRLTSWLNKPNRILKDYENLEIELKK